MRMVADAVAVEPVSTPKFPANREINREFRGFGRCSAEQVSTPTSNFNGLHSIPYTKEQGVFLKRTGKFIPGSGKLRPFNSDQPARHFTLHETRGRIR